MTVYARLDQMQKGLIVLTVFNKFNVSFMIIQKYF